MVAVVSVAVASVGATDIDVVVAGAVVNNVVVAGNDVSFVYVAGDDGAVGCGVVGSGTAAGSAFAFTTTATSDRLTFLPARPSKCTSPFAAAQSLF